MARCREQRLRAEQRLKLLEALARHTRRYLANRRPPPFDSFMPTVYRDWVWMKNLLEVLDDD